MNDDTISRQAAIDCEYQVKIINDIEYVMLSEVQMKMRKLPSAQADPCEDAVRNQPSAEPLTAYVISDEDGNIKCSNCGGLECWGNYCMNCGAKMRGENNG